jgi:antitoxin component YwqK of YwqJK toxin-antitoxin module
MVASAVPDKPPGVPEAGFWNPEVGGWEVSRRSAQGAREGECLIFRRDGRLLSRFLFAGGVQEGPFALFHPDGEVAREGTYVAGRLEGIVSAYTGEGPGAEPLRACCVPAAAVRLDVRYEAGTLVQEVFYDREGRPLLSDGRPWPARPAGVADDAEFDETGARWVRRRPDVQRSWTADGVLAEEIEFAGRCRRAVRRYDADGRLAESCEFLPDGARHGAFRRRWPADAETPYADPRIREERGAFAHGQIVGRWALLDASGNELRAVERGEALSVEAETTSPALAPASATADAWRVLARRLRESGRVREALCAAARAAVQAGDRVGLERALAADIAALAPPLAAERGEALTQATDLTVAAILDGLLGGADAAFAFRALGAVLPPGSSAASDFVEASLLLAPDRPMTHQTRALVRFQRGDEAGARADLAIVDGESPAAAESLRVYMRAALRPFAFKPVQEALAPDPALAGVPAGIARGLDEVRATIALYATRLARARAAVAAMAGSDAAPAAWWPPDLPALLPSGAVPLRRGRVKVSGEAPDGSDAEVEVDVDEEIATEGLGVPALLGEAQADWSALTWLCWSVGLDRVALPEAIAERPRFAEAMKQAVTRCWRALDRLNTGGLLARANGVPGFMWEGIDIDALPQHLARVVAEECLRARSMFLWLASPEVASPFQLDLRDG